MLVSVYAFMILLMYFLASISKILNFSATVEGLKTALGSILPNIFYIIAIIGAIIVELVAPIIVMLSLQTNMYREYAYYSSITLAVFTILATLIYHFPTNERQYYPFMKNLTATGSLLLLSTFF